ncbi:MAG: hypothetical protein U0930_11250 [Pirellulales bacterium]
MSQRSLKNFSLRSLMLLTAAIAVIAICFKKGLDVQSSFYGVGTVLGAALSFALAVVFGQVYSPNRARSFRLLVVLALLILFLLVFTGRGR